MAENDSSRPKRAVGDTTYTSIAQSSKGLVDESTFTNPSGTAGRHGALLAMGIVVVAAALVAVAMGTGVTKVLAVVGIVVGVGIAAVGVVGELRERAAMRAMAARIEREQRGPVA
jgi:hypothetical protein